MSRKTEIQAKSDSLKLSHTQIDAPLLDIHGIKVLHELGRENDIKFIIEETQNEAQHRRRIENKTANFVFIEKLIAFLIVVFIVMVGVGASIYCAIKGFKELSLTIAGICLGSLAIAVLRRDNPTKK
ncbi:hypothetical protein [Helicobacter cetorum]|uniref:hypothetical protein n=1 Tax=Helicobacter cetorum TaxID=138563 RepID=UPI0013151B6C|nr:hypothetical protein [Helicobacter cetorum]